MTKTNDPPLVASVSLIPDSDEKADLDAPRDESGKLVVGQVPNISISETIVVADQAERLSLEVQEGDVAIQQDTTESFIFTGGANELANWQLVQFDAVGGIAGEDIAPRDIDGRNVTLTDLSVNGLLNGADTSTAAAGEALTSDGTGGFGFASVKAIEEVATFVDLPAIDPPQIAFTQDKENYFKSTSLSGTPFDISLKTLETSVDTQDSSPSGLTFDNEGTRLYETGTSGDKIYQSSLSRPFDISTATFEKSIPAAGSDSDPVNQDIRFNNDGTKMFVPDSRTDEIFQLTLSTAFDIGTASLEKTIASLGTQIKGIEFDNNGTRLYEIGTENEKIKQSTLSTPFDIGTRTFEKEINSQDPAPQGLTFDNDGTRLYEIGSRNGTLYQSSLSTPFDVGTASFDQSISTEASEPRAVAFDNDGFRVYEVDTDAPDKILQLQIVTGGFKEF